MTLVPMTAPPLNAIGNDLLIPFLAALAARRLASVATSIPIQPAIALHTEPKRYAAAKMMLSMALAVAQIGWGRNSKSTIAIPMTKYPRVLYILLRKALAPSLMAPATNCIFSVALSCFLTKSWM